MNIEKGLLRKLLSFLLLKKWRKYLDNMGYIGAVLMDLSKPFDTLNHELFIAKLHAYGFIKDPLKIL